MVSGKLVDAVVDLGAIALMLGRIDRTACYHPDGNMRESDTDHTVMLALIAPALADLWPQYRLSRGKVAELAIVHDLVEVYAGDTPTLRALDSDQKFAKEDRERKAMERIAARFGPVMPWLPMRIFEYEQRRTPEARFVKAVDKMLPKIVHILDGAKGLREEGMGRAEFLARMKTQKNEIAEYANEFGELETLRWHLVVLAAEELE